MRLCLESVIHMVYLLTLYHAKYFNVLHSSLVSILSTWGIPVISMYFKSKWKKEWILIS